MPGPVLPRRLPGEELSARKLNELIDQVERSAGPAHFPGYAGSAGAFSSPEDDPRLLVEVLSSAAGTPPPHAWMRIVRAYDANAADGESAEDPDGYGGSTTVQPLYELNGRTLAAGEKVEAWPDDGGDFYWCIAGAAANSGAASYTDTTVTLSNTVLALNSTSTLEVNDTSTVEVNDGGEVIVLDGGSVTFQAGSTTTFDASSVVEFCGEITFCESAVLVFEPGSQTTYQDNSEVIIQTSTWTVEDGDVWTITTPGVGTPGEVVISAPTTLEGDVTYPSGQTSTYQDGSAVTLETTTWAINTGDTWTLSGPGDIAYNVPAVNVANNAVWTYAAGTETYFSGYLEVCGWFGWCWHTETLTADEDDWDVPGTESKVVLRVDPNGAARIVTGMTSHTDGQYVILVNITTDPDETLTLPNDDSSSSAGNRFLNPNGVDVVLGPREAAAYWKDPAALDDAWQCVGLAQDSRPAVRKNSAGSTFRRPRINLIEGSNITLTVADDATDDEVDVTIASTGGGGGGAAAWVHAATVLHSDFTAAAASESISVYSLPARGICQGSALKSTVAWEAGALPGPTCQLSVGVSGDTARYSDGFVPFQWESTVSDTHWKVYLTTNGAGPSYAGGDVLLTALANSDVDEGTAGEVEVWLLVSQLPTP